MKKSRRQRIEIGEAAIIVALVFLSFLNLLGSLRVHAHAHKVRIEEPGRSSSVLDRSEIDITVTKIEAAQDRGTEDQGGSFSPVAAAVLFGWDPPKPPKLVHQETFESPAAPQAIQAPWLQVVGLINSNGNEKYYIKDTRTGFFFYVQGKGNAPGEMNTGEMNTESRGMGTADEAGISLNNNGAKSEAILMEENEGYLIIRYQGELYEIDR